MENTRLIRVQHLSGIVDVSTPNDLAAFYKVVKADGYLVIFGDSGVPAQMIPYHAIVSIMEMPSAELGMAVVRGTA